jgi:hypothetical protein
MRSCQTFVVVVVGNGLSPLSMTGRWPQGLQDSSTRRDGGTAVSRQRSAKAGISAAGKGRHMW